MRIATVIAATMLGSTLAAQQVPVPDDLEMSPIMQAIMAQGQDSAVQQLGMRFERYRDGNSIRLEDLGAQARLETATDRAGKVANYLAADLDWDGVVTRDELIAFHAENDSAFVDGYLQDGDLNGDGQITVDEMLLDAANDHPDAGAVQDGILAEMITWDFDADGFLTFEEVLSVIVTRAE